MTVALAPAAALAAALVAAPALALAPTPAPVAEAASCSVSSGSFSWGFKESFRAYVSGSIANGEWTTAGDIGYATPSFFSDELAGVVRLDPVSGELGVAGALRFTGHEGILDTQISTLRFVLDASQHLVVVVDIAGTTQDFVSVDSVDVPFVAGDLNEGEWRADGGALTIENVPLALTAQGAEAFGTYPAGEPFDPVTLTLMTTPECASETLAARTAGDSTPLVVAAVALGGVVAGAILALMLRRRARSSTAAPPVP